MATTALLPKHQKEGKSILVSIKESLDYGKNPNKTRDGKLVSAYECDARTAHIQFTLAKKLYLAKTGRTQKNDVLLYQLRQSFKPGEITSEEANRISYELALTFTKGKHAFIVTTHEDKEHIHSHIYFNSTSLDYSRKFRNFWGSSRAIRRISDRICIENGLSIIENPKPSKGHYGLWLVEKKPTWQEKLRFAIDTALEQKPADMEAFIQAMIAQGYELSRGGKRISFKSPGKVRATTLRSLKGDYTDEAILERIEGKRIVVPKTRTEAVAEENSLLSDAPRMKLLIDIQNSIKAKNSPGYEQWAKVFNLKQAAQTLIYLQENNLTEYEKLEEKTNEATNLFNNLSVQIKEKETRMNEISLLQKQISNYSRTRDIYVDYRKSGYSKKFFSEHESEIILHQAAKKTFDELGLKKLPTIKSLQTEYATILAEKKKLYQSYRQAKDDMQKLAVAKSNTDRLLNYSSSGKDKEMERFPK